MGREYAFLLIVSCCLLSSFISLSNLFGATDAPTIRRFSRLTLLEEGHFRMETVYHCDPNVNAIIYSDAIMAAGNISNIWANVNYVNVSSDAYHIVTTNRSADEPCYQSVALNHDLNDYTDIRRENWVYLAFDFDQPLHPWTTVIYFLEFCQTTLRAREYEIQYELEICSEIDNYLPSVLNTQAEYEIYQLLPNQTLVCRTYQSRGLYDNETDMIMKPIQGIRFENVSMHPLFKCTCDVRILETNLIQENFQFWLSGKPFRPYEAHISSYILPETATLTDHPVIQIILDHEQIVPDPIGYDELVEILNDPYHVFTEPFYYFGKGVNLNNVTLYIGFTLPENSTAQIAYSFEYDATQLIKTQDGFNYNLVRRINVPLFSSTVEHYLKIEVPLEFVITSSNYQTDLISQGTRFRVFEFQKPTDYTNEEEAIIKIDFQRNETPVYNFLQILYIIIFVFFIFLLVFRRDLVVKNIKLIAPSLITTLLPFAFTQLSLNYNWIGSFIYTRSYLPIITVILVLIAWGIHERRMRSRAKRRRRITRMPSSRIGHQFWKAILGI